MSKNAPIQAFITGGLDSSIMDIYFEQYGQLNIRQRWGSPSQKINSITYDSRNAGPQSVFVCMGGENHDGHTFLEEAIAKGAAVLAGENAAILEEFSRKFPELTFLQTEDARAFLAQLSIIFHGRIHEKIHTVGITGTNGKTTVAAFVKSLMTALGIPSGSIGTNGVLSSMGPVSFVQSTPTTPEASDLHAIFADFAKRGDQLAAMEVSSVAIEQQRTAGINFDVAIHTNLSPEHLEFHKTFENYKQAKLKLFRQAKRAVVNLDDEGMGADIIKDFQGSLLTYSLKKDSAADVKASNIRVTNDGTSFELKLGNDSFIVRTPVFGSYNVANLLSAICTAMHLGFMIGQIIEALPRVENPSGRFEVLKEFGRRKIIIDYAHTPVALKSLLKEAKKLPHKRLIVMITGIGIRDKEKMPQMAQAVENQADQIIVSVDHPGFLDPWEVVGHVMKGFSNPRAGNILQEPTRRDGVLAALSVSDEDDLILLTSGCINGAQIVKGEKIPHSDKEIIQEFFRNLEESKALERYEA